MRMYTLLAVTASTLVLAGAAQAQQRPVGMTATFTPDPAPATAEAAVTAAEEAVALADTMTSAPANMSSTGDQGFSDADLASYALAVQQMQPILRAANGAPSPEQQAQLAAIVTARGLSGDQFNAISSAAASDAVLAARIAVAGTPASAPGSVAASVTDAELAQFAAATANMRPILEASGGAPNAEQQVELAAIVTAEGLTGERFNAIATAISGDDHLRARLQLAQARAG